MSVLAGKDFFNSVVSSTTAFLSRAIEHLFGAGIYNPAVGPITWADLLVALIPILFVVLVNVVVAVTFRFQANKTSNLQPWRRHLFGGIGGPIYLFLWIGGIYLAMAPLLLKLWTGSLLKQIEHVLNKIFGVAALLALLWLCFRLTRVAEARLSVWAEKIPGRPAKFLVPLLGRSLRVIVPVLIIIFALPVLGFPKEYEPAYELGSSILIICAIAWILVQAVSIGQKALIAGYDIQAADNLQARKIYTQTKLIGRTLHVVIGLCAIASILMLFQEVRHLGASLLASAGIVGIIAGVAAQKTLSNFFAGFQIALAQPIRQDDVVIVEGEWGRIEEITLTYVVVHIWDDRRLILPLSYFIEKPFQNWTRASAQLLGSVFVWVDYSFPVDDGRKALKEIIENHPLWDKRFWNLQVSDATEKTMQLRILATTADASKGWDLRCAIREKFIAYVQKNHPQSLPRVRAELNSIETKSESQKLSA
ncbi:MAG TPA: mechanosensitive ion channel domain-containing protein [Verrucomicrobiae bacterium]